MHDKFCLILPGRWIRKHIVRYSAVSLQCASAWLMKVTAAGRGTAGQRHQIMRGHSNNLPDKVRDGEHSELCWAVVVSYGELCWAASTELWWALLSRVTRETLLISPQCPQLPCLCNYAGTQQSEQSCRPSVRWCFICNDWFSFLWIWIPNTHHFKIEIKEIKGIKYLLQYICHIIIHYWLPANYLLGISTPFLNTLDGNSVCFMGWVWPPGQLWPNPVLWLRALQLLFCFSKTNLK